MESSIVNLDQTIENLSALSVEERLQIVQRLWDTIPAETPVQLSPSQKEELELRIAAHDADPDSALTREQLEARLKSSR
ncbi:MAG: addiction module protein [Planctomycetaceae bacterium]|nr:addiction module protein [Planctomycetaceae bacterium]